MNGSLVSGGGAQALVEFCRDVPQPMSFAERAIVLWGCLSGLVVGALVLVLVLCACAEWFGSRRHAKLYRV